MAKCGKLSKLKTTVMKKWSSFGRASSSSSISSSSDDGTIIMSIDKDNNSNDNDKHLLVYVGKSRRRYLIDSNTAANPIFRELVERSSSSLESGSDSESVVICCEVVLFEHLLWMLQSCDNVVSSSADWQVSELVEFYSY